MSSIKQFRLQYSQ